MQNSLYPTDLNDEQWNLFRLVLPPRKRPKSRGRPATDWRRICNALRYFVRAGCAWRLLPRDFGPWKTGYDYFWLWTNQGDRRRPREARRARRRREPAQH